MSLRTADASPASGRFEAPIVKDARTIRKGGHSGGAKGITTQPGLVMPVATRVLWTHFFVVCRNRAIPSDYLWADQVLQPTKQATST
jgi:hypothetical protein